MSFASTPSTLSLPWLDVAPATQGGATRGHGVAFDAGATGARLASPRAAHDSGSVALRLPEFVLANVCSQVGLRSLVFSKLQVRRGVPRRACSLLAVFVCSLFFRMFFSCLFQSRVAGGCCCEGSLCLTAAHRTSWCASRHTTRT